MSTLPLPSALPGRACGQAARRPRIRCVSGNRQVARRSRRAPRPARCASQIFGYPPYRDAIAAGLALIGSIGLVKTFDALATSGALDRKLARKLVHICAGPGFMLTWPLFSDSSTAPLVAACVPALNGIRLLLVGLGLWKQEGMVKSVSRSGDKSELLRGPLIYVCVLCSVTVLSWRDSAAGIMVIAMMCGGDGAADIIGRKWGTTKLPWNTNKSFAGSVAMLLGGALLGLGLLAYFHAFNYVSTPALAQLPVLLTISAVCTVVESLPIAGIIDDNLSVPLAATIMGYFLLPWASAALML